MINHTITFADYEALDKKVESKIKEFLNKAYNHTWYIDTEVAIVNGYFARLVEIKLKDGEVCYVERNERGEESFIMEEMAYGQILQVLCCLPNEEKFSRLNELLKLDAKYNINEMLNEHPYHTDWGEVVHFEVRNDTVRLTNKHCTFEEVFEIDDFIKYVKDNAINALCDNFFSCDVCWCHGDDFVSNAQTWFTDKYSVVTIYDSNEEENKEPLVFVFDFNEIKIDFEHFIECDIDYHTMIDTVDKARMKIK